MWIYGGFCFDDCCLLLVSLVLLVCDLRAFVLVVVVLAWMFLLIVLLSANFYLC